MTRRSDTPVSRSIGPKTRLGLPILLVLTASLAFATSSVAETPPAGESDPAVDPPPGDAIRALIREGHFSEAESQARSLLSDTEKAHGTDSIEAAAAIDLLVDAMLHQGKADEPDCLELAERALRIKESILGPQDLGLAHSLNTLGQIHGERGQYSEAQLHLERSLKIKQDAFGDDSPKIVSSVQALAILYSEMGLYDEARSMFERALVIVERDRGARHKSLVPLEYHLATVLRRLGEYEESERVYTSAISLAEETHGTDHPMLAYLQNGLANLYDERGEYTKARETFERAIRLGEMSLGPDHPFIASCWNNLGCVLKNIGDYAEAEEAFEKSLELHKKHRGVNHRYTASTMTNLATVYLRVGRYEEAESLYEESLAIRDSVLGPDHTEVATNLLDLAELCLELGQSARARVLSERALAITEKRFGHEHPDTAPMLFALARALDESGDLQSAEPVYADALDIVRRTLGPEHPQAAPILLCLGWLHARTGERWEAMRSTLHAEAISRDHAHLMAGALPERQALRYSSVRSGGLDLALTLATSGGLDKAAHTAAWDAVTRSRALVLDAMAARRRGLRHESPEVSRLASDYALASKRLADLLVRGPEPEDPRKWRERVHTAREEREEIERALARASAAFREDQSRENTGLAEVLASLPAGSALVAYVHYDHWEDQASHATTNTLPPGSRTLAPSYLAFIQREGQSEPTVVPLGPAESIDNLVAAWSRETVPGRHSASGSDAATRSYRAVGEDLRAAVWDPLAEYLSGAGTVFLVPDGSLYRVSFAALPVGPGSYLVEQEMLIHYLSAERDLVTASRSARPGTGLLAVGGPSFGEHLAEGSGFAGFPSFEPLPASAAEARAIADLWTQAAETDTVENPADGILLKTAAEHLAGPAAREAETNAALVLIGSDATEAAVKRLAPGHRILHLATHGFFLDSDRRPPLMRMTARGIGGLTVASGHPPPRTSENPLQLSGLALAGANRRHAQQGNEEDGVLTAEEIAAMDLSGVEWVVLSACDTGIGRVESGEGVFGLQRSFQIAGSQTLIMSLWSVEDESAREWMEVLYGARLLGKMTTIESVHHACTEILKRRRSRHESDHPFFWAGFVASGGWQ